jgi:hypothetical protein
VRRLWHHGPIGGSRNQTRVLRRLLALCLPAALLLAACGDLPDAKERPEPAHRVTSAEVVRQAPAGTPERAFLEWYRALQLGDDDAVAAAYKPSLKIVGAGVGLIRALAPKFLASLGPPRIVGVTHTPKSRYTPKGASVYAILPNEMRQPNGRIDVFRRPRAFHFVRVGGEWKLNDFKFMQNIAVSGARGDSTGAGV